MLYSLKIKCNDCSPIFKGQLIREFNWGPSQPSGGDQHCMYIVGGYLGYQWADFHCGFEMTFLCEYKVNDHEAWRRRRQMKNSALFKQDFYYKTRKVIPPDAAINKRINYTLAQYLNNHPHITRKQDTPSSSMSASIREDLNAKFKGDKFLVQNNEQEKRETIKVEIGKNEYPNNKHLSQKSVIITTNHPNKNSVIISTLHKRRHPFDMYDHKRIKSSIMNVTSSRNKHMENIYWNSVKTIATSSLQQIGSTTTTTPTTSFAIPSRVSSTKIPQYKPSTLQDIATPDKWSIFAFLKNIVQLG